MAESDAAPRATRGTEGEGAATGGAQSEDKIGDGTDVGTQNIEGDGNNDDKARQQRAWDWDSTNRVTAPPMAADGVERGGNGGAVGGCQKGAADSLSSAVTPTAMVGAAALSGQEGLPENSGGG